MEVLFTQIGAVAVAIIAAWQAIRIEQLRRVKKTQDAQIKQINKHFSALSMFMDFELINSVANKVNEIFANTAVDRFLLLIAVNGKVHFNVVSVLYELHKRESNMAQRINAIERYSHVAIDSDYRMMLATAEENGHAYIDVDSMKSDSILYNLYRSEGVTAAVVNLIARSSMDEDNDILVYCSFATHDESKISQRDIAFIKTVYGGIKHAFKAYIASLMEDK